MQGPFLVSFVEFNHYQASWHGKARNIILAHSPESSPVQSVGQAGRKVNQLKTSVEGGQEGRGKKGEKHAPRSRWPPFQGVWRSGFKRHTTREEEKNGFLIATG